MTASRVYIAIPAVGPGLPGVNYNETRYGYDIMNRQNMNRTPGGTITRTVFDVRDNAVQTFVGTDDAGATDESPDGFGAPGNNMQNTVTNVFDNGDMVGGNNLLTTTIQHIDFTSENDRLATFAYDFRNRRTTTTAYISPTYYGVVTFNTFDNLDRVTQAQQYDTTIAPANLIRWRQMFFDWLGRQYQTQIWGVTVGTGAWSAYPLLGNTWFNALNQPVKQAPPGGSLAYTKTAYDLVNRVIGTYTGYAPGGDTNPWAPNSSDKIFEQASLTLDAVGNVLQTAMFQLNQGYGEATGVLTSSIARVSYSGSWFDGIGRTIATANYGTNWFDPTQVLSPPTSSPTVLVNQTLYNARGEAYLSVDPAGKVMRADSDDAGRTILTTDNYVPPGPCPACGATGPCGCAVPDPWPRTPGACAGNDQNVMVATTYTPDGNVASLTALNPATGPQTTRYLYGTTLETVAGTTGGNAVARSDLLVGVLYPDASDSADCVQFAYNLQSQVNWMQDQNGTVHGYSFDGFGRRTADNILAFGPNVDESTQSYSYEYEERGMLVAVSGTGNTGGSSVYSYVAFYYDAFEQLTLEAQVFYTSPGSGIDQAVAYANFGNAGGANTVRRTSITYPYSAGGSRVVSFNYNSGDDSALNRVSSLSFTGAVVAAWNYFGLSSVAETEYDAAAITSTLASGSSYPGLDLFGRIINLPWTQSSTVLAELNYGYDQASNRTYRQDAKAGTNFDELYSYDAMRRLRSAARGTLTSGLPPITNPTLQQSWHLDATGNWANFNSFDLVTASNSLMQQRASNAANEITGLAATVGSTWQTPAYDRNGNMTTIPQPLAPAEGYTGVWDAWNRLIYLQSGDENVEFCLYDGLNRRVMRNQYSSGTLTESRFFTYSDQWQVLEEYVAATSLTVPVVQWAWGLRYIDDCVLRDTLSDGSLALRLYALQDANWNVVAVYNPASGGSIVERYAYTPYGVVQFLNASFAPLAGNVSAYSWETLYCGYRYDGAVGLYLARNRQLNPPLGCW